MAVYPNVPDVPGVPPVPRDPDAQASSLVAPLTDDDAAISLPATNPPQWGIFLNNEPVVMADSVIDFTYKQEWVISDYSVEQGGFESYNKVSLPFDARVRFAAGGSESNRNAFLDSIVAIAGDLNLYDVATPEVTYLGANIVHYDYKRTNINGVGLIQVDIWLLEVRVTGSQTFSNTQQPSGADVVNGGQVQPTTPTPAQELALAGILD